MPRFILNATTTNPDIPFVQIQILDLFPAEGAWSIHHVAAVYAGKCMRVRRSSDNSETDIGFNGTDWDTDALLAFAGVDSAYVTRWYDQSGNSRDFVQATAANQPRVVNAGVLDTNGPWFDGTTDTMSYAGAFLYAAGEATVAAVISGDSWVSGKGASTGHILAESNSAETTGRYIPLSRGSSSGNEHRAAAYVITDAGTTVMTNYKGNMFDSGLHQMTFLDDGDSTLLRGDGASGAAVAYTRATTTVNTLNLAARLHSGGAATFFQGHIPEVLAWGEEFSLTDAGKVESNQKQRFNTP